MVSVLPIRYLRDEVLEDLPALSRNQWLGVRGSAEAIKREIYRYRARTGDYSKDRLTTNSRDDVFHERLEPVSRRLMQTDVNHGALKLYEGPLPPKEVAQQNDDGFSFLTPERYIELRLEDLAGLVVTTGRPGYA